MTPVLKLLTALLAAMFILAACQPQSEKMTPSDVRALAALKEELTWKDLEGFDHEEVGSGLYILKFEINGSEGYVLLAGGGSKTEPPLYVTLQSPTGESWEIRNEELPPTFPK